MFRSEFNHINSRLDNLEASKRKLEILRDFNSTNLEKRVKKIENFISDVNLAVLENKKSFNNLLKEINTKIDESNKKTNDFSKENYFVYRNTRLYGHYESKKLHTVEKCWESCLKETQCAAISYQDSSKKKHHECLKFLKSFKQQLGFSSRKETGWISYSTVDLEENNSKF